MASKTIIKLKLIFKAVNKSHEWLTYFRLNILKYVTVFKYGETKCVTFDPGSRTNSIYIQSQLDTVQFRPINNNDFFIKFLY